MSKFERFTVSHTTFKPSQGPSVGLVIEQTGRTTWRVSALVTGAVLDVGTRFRSLAAAERGRDEHRKCWLKEGNS